MKEIIIEDYEYKMIVMGLSFYEEFFKLKKLADGEVIDEEFMERLKERDVPSHKMAYDRYETLLNKLEAIGWEPRYRGILNVKLVVEKIDGGGLLDSMGRPYDDDW